MVTILGTGHVFDLRERVQAEIFARAPTAVAIELDPVRYRALQTPKEQRKKGPFFYQILANFQDRIAEAYGVEAGDDMLAASDAARQMSVPICLIDRDAQKTFRRLIQETPLTEKLKLMGSVVGSVFLPTRSVEAQVKEMEQDYTKYFQELGHKFPTLKRVLLDERNEHMAAAIRDLSEPHPNLVAVLGDGHVDGVVEILNGWGVEAEALRLKDLRASTTPLVPPAPENTSEDGTTTARVSFDVSDAPPPERREGGLD